MKLKHLLGIGAVVAVLHIAAPKAVMQAAGAQTWTSAYDSNTSTDFATTRGSVSAGSTLVNGWIDIQGNIYTTGSGLLTGTSDASASPYFRDFLARPASENQINQREVVTYIYSAVTRNLGLRYQSASKNYYLFSIGTGGPSVYASVGGSLSSTIYLPGSWTTAPTAGDTLTVDMQAVGSSPTTIRLIVTDVTTAAVLVNQTTLSDNAASLQVAGACVISAPGASSTAYTVSRVQTFNVSPTSVTILPNDAAWIYSPYNWAAPTISAASSVNPGAYARILFTGTSAVLNFNTASNSGQFPTIVARVDGGAWVPYTVAATVNLGTYANRKHLLEIVFQGAVQSQDRWNSPTTVVMLTGLTVDNGATWAAPVRRAKNLLVYGDSITEGNLVTGTSNDASLGYAYNLGIALNAEVGVVAFGGTGLTTTASLSVGNVPGLTTSYNLLYSGVSRVFSPAPDAILYAEGRNDGGASAATVTANLTTVASALLTAYPNARQVVSIPLAQTQAAALRQTVTNLASSKITILETSGWVDLTNDASDGTHPYAYAHLGKMLPNYAQGVAVALYPPFTGTKRRLQ